MERGSALWAPLATGKTHASFLPDIALGHAMTVDWCRGTTELGKRRSGACWGGARTRSERVSRSETSGWETDG